MSTIFYIFKESVIDKDGGKTFSRLKSLLLCTYL